jgi:hypothetical protein
VCVCVCMYVYVCVCHECRSCLGLSHSRTFNRSIKYKLWHGSMAPVTLPDPHICEGIMDVRPITVTTAVPVLVPTASVL